MRNLAVFIAALSLPASALAQHTGHSMSGHTSVQPTMGGQYAFATIGEIVKILKADSTTDWAKVDLEKLRQHLIDMDDVTMRAVVASANVAGGVRLDITGTGRTIAAIRRTVTSHAHVLDEHTNYRPVVAEIPNGARLTVTAKDMASSKTVAMIRGLGFAGIMVEGDHHAEHHLMMARGTVHH